MRSLKYALADWPAVATATKIAAHATAGYKQRYYDYPTISNVRRFYKAAVYAYVAHLQETKATPPAGLEFLGELNVSAAIIAHTEPLLGHPRLTQRNRRRRLRAATPWPAKDRARAAVTQPTCPLTEPLAPGRRDCESGSEAAACQSPLERILLVPLVERGL